MSGGVERVAVLPSIVLALSARVFSPHIFHDFSQLCGFSVR